jgi:methionyl-tRNA synthetase
MGIMLWPFAPKAAMSILFYFDIYEEPKLSLLEKLPELNIKKDIKVIFNKISEEKIDEIKKFE